MNETYVVIIRYLGIFLTALSTFLALKIFLDLNPNNSSTLLSILGWLLFVPLMQFGFGRPSYSILRRKKIEGDDLYNFVRKFVNIATLQALLTCILMIALSYFISIQNGYTENKLELIIFSTGLVSFSVCTLKRDISYALDLEIKYEIIEAFRRLMLLLIYVGIYFDIGFYKAGLIGVFIGSSTFILMRSIIIKSVSLNNLSGQVKKDFLKKDFGINALRYWGFTVSELVFYNIPLIFFTFFPSPLGIAYYAIWSRFWAFLIMPYRIFVDTKINSIVTAYIKRNNSAVKKGLLACISFSSVIVVFYIVILINIGPSIYKFLGAEDVVDSFFMISLSIWIAGNIIQHTFGSFILSYGKGFNFALKVSILCVLITVFIFINSFSKTGNIGYSLTICGIFYFLTSIIYFLKSFKVINNNTSNNLR